MSATAIAEPATVSIGAEGWTIHRVDEVESTHSIAATLPPWHAVRARVQTAGKGRCGHSWVSNDGGLWLSAVLPCAGKAAPESTLALAVASSLMQSLETYGAHGFWLRWPNDIMVGRQKIGGIFIEEIREQSVVVGVGLNIFNHPEAVDPALADKVARLADFTRAISDLGSIELVVLRALRRAQRAFCRTGFSPVAHTLNLGWSCPSHLEVTLADGSKPVAGFFQGIDEEGRMRLVAEHGDMKVYSVSQVTEVRELD